MKVKHLLLTFWQLLRDTIISFRHERIWRKAAAIAFYTLFTTGPMLVLILHLASLLTGNDDVRKILMEWIQLAAGDTGAEAVGELLDNFSLPKAGVLGYVIGTYMLFSGGINAVGQLRETISSILKVDEGDRNNRPVWFAVVIDAAFVIAITFLVMASGLVGMMFYYIRSMIEVDVPFMFVISRVFGIVVSLSMLVLALGCIYRYLPARKLSWFAIGTASLMAAPLFMMVRFSMIAWFANADLESVYGSISFMVVFLLLAYVSVQVVLLGAIFAGVVEEHRRDR